MAMTTTIQIVIQTAGLIVDSQKPIKTDAALSSAGSTITQLYLKRMRNVSYQLQANPIVPVIPAHGKRQARVYEAFS